MFFSTSFEYWISFHTFLWLRVYVFMWLLNELYMKIVCFIVVVYTTSSEAQHLPTPSLFHSQLKTTSFRNPTPLSFTSSDCCLFAPCTNILTYLHAKFRINTWPPSYILAPYHGRRPQYLTQTNRLTSSRQNKRRSRDQELSINGRDRK